MSGKTKLDQLNRISKKVKDCRKCSLYRQAIKAVPGEGSPEAEIFFAGEGPGFHEDQQGRPFVGAAGKLLDKMLKETGLNRKDVFIGNMIKHRPPENRDPEPDELAACKEWLDAQLEVIQPKIIVTLGRFSMAKFIANVKISQIHGQPRFINYQGRKALVMPMYHPAAALRNGRVMEQFREDFLRLPEFLARFKKLTEELPETVETEKTEEAEAQMNLL